MKKWLTTISDLTILKVEKTYVFIDASKEGCGGILIQEGNVIAYTSGQLHSYKKSYVTHDLKLEAMLYALKL